MSTRTRKSDIDDARQLAEKYAKIRDDLNNDPRRKEIPKEIKSKEDEISKIDSQIAEDKSLLIDLRQCAETLNSISIFERQIRKDMEQARLLQLPKATQIYTRLNRPKLIK